MSKLVLPPLHRVFVSIISLEKFLYKAMNKSENENLSKDSVEENKLNQAENKIYEKEKLSEMRMKCA